MQHEIAIPTTIFKNVTFTTNETALITSKLEKIELPKGNVLLKAGDWVAHQYYVHQGCLRTFFIDASGKEHTMQFAIHDWWISDYTAFFTSGKAIMHIEVIQEATLYRLSKKNMEALYDEVPKLESFFRKKLESGFASFQKRILANLSQSAKERYIAFRTDYPNIEQSVKNYHVASYLGITTESLSRIRKEIATQ